jgi:6-pyruvoyltetrahydropterin/6-carboxytetrahydropterin synthase
LYLIKVRTTFSAALRLHSRQLSEEQNYALYGVCASPHGHGHDYEVEVAFEGKMDPVTGMVANFYDLQQLVDKEIFQRVDHKNLNTDVDFLQGLVPTTENLAAKFWELVKPHCPKGLKLHSITIGERSNNIVTYFGPDDAPVGNPS